MNKVLIITNGDSAAAILQKVYSDCAVLPWRDVLHEGPVPFTEDLSSLSLLRAEYLSNEYSLDLNQTIGDFKERDEILQRYKKIDRIVLWFEHDLYDQLQLIQILDYFATVPLCGTLVHLVQADDFLGEQTIETIRQFIKLEKAATADQLSLAQKSWSAFRESGPETWAKLLRIDTTALPFLKAAVQRMLEELPSCSTGISRTQSQILDLVSRGISDVKILFAQSQMLEEAAFMGDWSFFNQVSRLIKSSIPLINVLNRAGRIKEQSNVNPLSLLESEFELTKFGQAVLSGAVDNASKNNVDYWWGGTRIHRGNLWRWNSSTMQVINS